MCYANSAEDCGVLDYGLVVVCKKVVFMDAKLIEKLAFLKNKIGNTPIVCLSGGMFAKLEKHNPAGSIKDRVAYYATLRAVECGALKSGTAIVEATSGNMGIALAYVAHEIGVACKIVMPENMSKKRMDIIRAYGAELILTPCADGMSGAVRKAKEIANEGGFFVNQFENNASVEAHLLTTAPEIFCALPTVKYIVVGIGSGGTAMGIKRYIEQNELDCKVIALEPSSSPLLSKGYAGQHAIQGIGANFVPKILDKTKLDGIICVDDDDALNCMRKLYADFGLKCGISSGAAYMAASTLQKCVDGDILAIFPDDANRYDNLIYAP